MSEHYLVLVGKSKEDGQYYDLLGSYVRKELTEEMDCLRGGDYVSMKIHTTDGTSTGLLNLLETLNHKPE